MSSEILKKFVCTRPFQYLDFQQTSQWVCCPSWCPTNISNSSNLVLNLKRNVETNWFSETAQDIRASVMDGSYRHCDKAVCPSLNKLINAQEVSENFIPVESVKKILGINSLEDLSSFRALPEEIVFGFDRSCNLKCPSCRIDLVANDSTDSIDYKMKLHMIHLIESKLAGSLKKIYITGSGDPFYSKIYRDYLMNFDINKYPNLEYIILITNGILLNQKMWQSLKAAPYVKSIEVSLDAGTQITYETLTRLGGDWVRLIDNLNFLSTLKTLDNIVLSFVVSENNFLEMKTFYDLMMTIFKNSNAGIQINFRQLVHWDYNAYSKEQTESLQVFNSTHPKYENFKKEFEQILGLPNITHNFY